MVNGGKMFEAQKYLLWIRFSVDTLDVVLSPFYTHVLENSHHLGTKTLTSFNVLKVLTETFVQTLNCSLSLSHFNAPFYSINKSHHRGEKLNLRKTMYGGIY